MALAIAASASRADATRRADAVPVVAAHSVNGFLVPIAACSGSDWAMLAWPSRETLDDEELPRVPARLAEIPLQWIAPLKVFPLEWRVQIIGPRSRVARAMQPVRSDIGAGSIAVQLNYPRPGAFALLDEDNGIAVAGSSAATVLPVRHLGARSSAWRRIVGQHAGKFPSDRSAPRTWRQF